jgi:hypothetical protein
LNQHNRRVDDIQKEHDRLFTQCRIKEKPVQDTALSVLQEVSLRIENLDVGDSQIQEEAPKERRQSFKTRERAFSVVTPPVQTEILAVSPQKTKTPRDQNPRNDEVARSIGPQGSPFQGLFMSGTNTSEKKQKYLDLLERVNHHQSQHQSFYSNLMVKSRQNSMAPIQ